MVHIRYRHDYYGSEKEVTVKMVFKIDKRNIYKLLGTTTYIKIDKEGSPKASNVFNLQVKDNEKEQTEL